MARKGKRQAKCAVFEFDRIEQWGPELKRVFKDALPRRTKRIFEAEPPDDMEHSREILLAHMSIERLEVVTRLKNWIVGKRIAAYFGVWMTDADLACGAVPDCRSELSLSRAPFVQFFEAYVPRVENADAKQRIVRIEINGADVLKRTSEEVDALPNVIRAMLDAWSYWLANPEFSPADECLLVL